MFCEKCGTKNQKKSKFCEKCGSPLNNKNISKKNIEIIEKVKGLSQKTKIGIITIILFLLLLIVILSILLNNPTKKVEDYLTNYYNHYYAGYNNKELKEIGKILKSKKSDKDALNNIEKQASKTIKNWVKNFNKSYKNKDELLDEYKKINGILKSIYGYYQGLEYILDNKTYQEYEKELDTLYISKNSYLQALNYEEEDYERYYYAQRVDKKDSYYKEASLIVEKFVKESIEELNKEIKEKLNTTDNSLEEEKFKNYLEILDYLKDNKYFNNLDLSDSEEFKKLYQEYVSKMIDSLKKYTESLVKEGKIKETIEVIDSAVSRLDSDSPEYQELNKLKKDYESSLPINILNMYKVSTKGTIESSKYITTINDKEYDSYISYCFSGENAEVTYRTNKEYKKFMGQIVIGQDWDKDFKVTVKIYGDDKEIYNLNITKDSKINDKFDLDISNINDIRIEFISESGNSSNNNSRYLYIVEPYLYK